MITADEVANFAAGGRRELIAVLAVAKRMHVDAETARGMLRGVAGTCEVIIEGVQCDRPTFAKGYCAGHYQQQRQKKPLGPLRTKRGEGHQETIRMPIELWQQTVAAAKEDGEDVREWWRQAAREKLERRGK